MEEHCVLTRLSAGAPGYQAALGTGNLQAGSTEVTGVLATAGGFTVGREIEGAGIPANTTITAVGPGTLTLSAPATLAGSAVALHSDDSHVMFVPAVAADGYSVYFTAFGVLAPGGAPYPAHYPLGGNPFGVAQDENGQVNLYRYDAETHRTSYVATVDTLDYSDETECGTFITPEKGNEGTTGLCDKTEWYTTPDGQYLLFGASLPIDGYNAEANGCAERGLPATQAFEDGRCEALYRYSAPAAEQGEQPIVCVSCGSAEADAAGNAEFARSTLEGPDSGPPRGISNNGEYVFFDTQGALVPQASNHTLDTYQWREDLGTHERSIALVGSGTDPAPTFFLGYAPNPAAHSEQAREAGSVFIGTHAALSTVQTNSVGNVYDARVCVAESPCIQPPLGETVQCEGGECQHPPALPLFQSPATNTLTSSGNIASPPPAIVKPKTAAQLKAEKLAKALETCRKEKSKAKRKSCEASAQKKYGVTKPKKAKKAKKASHNGRAK